MHKFHQTLLLSAGVTAVAQKSTSERVPDEKKNAILGLKQKDLREMIETSQSVVITVSCVGQWFIAVVGRGMDGGGGGGREMKGCF